MRPAPGAVRRRQWGSRSTTGRWWRWRRRRPRRRSPRPLPVCGAGTSPPVRLVSTVFRHAPELLLMNACARGPPRSRAPAGESGRVQTGGVPAPAGVWPRQLSSGGSTIGVRPPGSSGRVFRSECSVSVRSGCSFRVGVVFRKAVTGCHTGPLSSRRPTRIVGFRSNGPTAEHEDRLPLHPLSEPVAHVHPGRDPRPRWPRARRVADGAERPTAGRPAERTRPARTRAHLLREGRGSAPAAAHHVWSR